MELWYACPLIGRVWYQYIMSYWSRMILLITWIPGWYTVGRICTHVEPLRWRRNGHGGVSNHQPHHCLLSRLFGCRSKKTSKLRVTGLCVGNTPGTGEFPAQMASNAENVSIWWRHLAYRPVTHRQWINGRLCWYLLAINAVNTIGLLNLLLNIF